MPNNTFYTNPPAGSGESNVSTSYGGSQMVPSPFDLFEFSQEFLAKYLFLHWNTQADGNGTSYEIGEYFSEFGNSYYAIWEEDVDLITKKSNLKSVAAAIRTKGGTSVSLEYPNDFVTAIGQIETGITPSGTISITQNGAHDVTNYATASVSVAGYTIDEIAERNMIGGEITGNASFIASYAFCYYNTSFLTTASFPNCTTIRTSAFYFCTQLTTVSFPNCTTIGSYAFQNCTKLTTASFSKCTTIGNNAFYFCSGLTTASFPSCTTVSNYGLYGCSRLTTINFPNCTTIGGSAFGYCSSLTTASFPKCTTIGSSAFLYCYNLSSAYFSGGLISSIYQAAFQQVGKSVVCTISFGSYVNAIQSYAFRSCFKLQSLYLNHVSQVPTLSANAFTSSPMSNYSTSLGAWGKIYVPNSLLASFKAATNWTAISARIVSG